ncbi:MAG: hypothetical protein GY794_02595 [bacterium]|nr:hypothetical protein [bacterium]
MKRNLITAIIIALAAAGCDETVYNIQLTPKDKQLTRTLTVWRHGTESKQSKKIVVKEMDADELAAVAKAYPNSKPKGGAKKHVFTGTFSGAMPNDVGGAGRFIRYESKMGVVSSYVERFRGNDQPGEVIETSLKAVDRITDILIGYLETQLGKETDFPKLRKFMDTKFRKDLKNISAYSYLAFNTSRLNWIDVLKEGDHEVQTHETILRAAAYLVERGYLETDELPLVQRAMNSREKDRAERTLKMILIRIFKRQTGITNTKFLTRLEKILTDRDTFEAYIAKTPEYKKLAGQAGDSKEKAAATQLVLKPMIEKILCLRLDFGGTPKLEVQLLTPDKPIATNGKWNQKERTITWKGVLTKRDKKTTSLPEICYAIWSRPDETFQEAHFGKVILTAKSLGEYGLWRQGLGDDEAKLWDTVISKHKPGQDLKTALQTATDPNKPSPYFKQGLQILQNAMK